MFSELDSAWTVNGTPIYRPPKDGVVIEHDNIVSPDSGRDEAGYMHIIWVRPDITKVNFTYEKLTGNQVAYLKALMQGKEFTFTYEDNGTKTINAYVGKMSYGQRRLDLFPEEGGVYTKVQVNVVEM